jgi:phosphatidate cytidylyltransferase
MKFSETTTRVLVAAVGIPIAVLVAFAGRWVLAAVLAALAAVTALEFYRLVEAKGIAPLRAPGALLAASFVGLAAIDPGAGPEGAGFVGLMVFATLAVASAAIWARGATGQPLLVVSATLTGAFYAGALFSFALFLRHLPDSVGARHGTMLLFAPILVTWASDTSAYFVGRAWGTRKLIPSISPGKTVQGAAGAVVGAVAVAIGCAWMLGFFPTYRMGIVQAITFGLLVSLAAQVGDLVESLFKRDGGVKDSGRLLPGHGGALDRFDSLLFTLPLGYFYFRFVVGPLGPF